MEEKTLAEQLQEAEQAAKAQLTPFLAQITMEIAGAAEVACNNSRVKVKRV